MSIHEELAAELKDAIRGRDRRRMDVIRQVETEVARARTEPGFHGEVDDALYRRVIGDIEQPHHRLSEIYRPHCDSGALLG